MAANPIKQRGTDDMTSLDRLIIDSQLVQAERSREAKSIGAQIVDSLAAFENYSAATLQAGSAEFGGDQ